MTSINEGMWDRGVRIVIGLVFGYLAVMSWPGAVAAVSALFSALLIATGFIGWCPMYTAYKFSTAKRTIP